MATEQMNINADAAEAVNQALKNICYEFANLVSKYPEIINGIKESGWTGESNSNFIGKSESYIENLNTIKGNLDEFAADFAARANSAINSMI